MERSITEFVVRVFIVFLCVSWRAFSDQSGVNFDCSDKHFTITKVGEVPFDFELVGEDEACRGQLVSYQLMAQSLHLMCSAFQGSHRRIALLSTTDCMRRIRASSLQTSTRGEMFRAYTHRCDTRPIATIILQLVWTCYALLVRNLQRGSRNFLRQDHFSSTLLSLHQDRTLSPPLR